MRFVIYIYIYIYTDVFRQWECETEDGDEEYDPMDDYWSVIESEQQITDQGVRHDFLMEGDDYNNNNLGIKDEHDGGDDYINNNSGI